MPREENRAENLTSVCMGLNRKAKGIPVFAGARIYHFSLHSSECTDKPFTAGLWMHLVWEASFYSGKSQLRFYSTTLPPPPHTHPASLQDIYFKAVTTWTDFGLSIDLIETSAGIGLCPMTDGYFFFIYTCFLSCLLLVFCSTELLPLSILWRNIH